MYGRYTLIFGLAVVSAGCEIETWHEGPPGHEDEHFGWRPDDENCAPDAGVIDSGCACDTPRPDAGPPPPPQECPDPADVTYFSTDVALCGAITFRCPADWVPFDDACGCGCVPPAEPPPPPPPPPPGPECPDPTDPRVIYLCSSPDICSQIEFTCPAPKIAFSSDCGCGCFDPS